MGMHGMWMTRGLEARYRRPALLASRATSLNPLGELFVVLLIIVVIVGAVAHEPLIAAVGALAFVIAIASRIWAALSLEEITIDRTASVDHAFQDDEIEITFTIENRKPLPVPWLEINEYIPRGLLIEGQRAIEQAYLGGAEIQASTSLGGYERIKIKRKLTALSRGTYRLGKTRLRSGDLFGLYPSDAMLDHTPWSIYVYPTIKALPGFTLPARRPIGDSMSRDRLWDDPSRPAGVREYRPGDPIKRIDWKTTARRGDMFVRQFDPSVSEHAVIFAEAITTSVPWEGYRSDVLEGSMTAAASLANHALNLGYNVGLVTNGVSSVSASRSVVLPGTGPSQLTMLLESLAMVHPIGVRTLDELARSRRGAIPPGATLIHIGGIYHPTTMGYLLGLKRQGHPVILFHTGREDPPDYPDFEVRDGRAMFLDESHVSGVKDFQRPPIAVSEWDDLPVVNSDSNQVGG
ncbi:DUF58 domain-containing protein [Candidatus Lucifugimonas marina]|uniref:DUF58 domain-containing protein n=1 Tax=Candidatus Lucifugimonas marina TaxID=3038979 RepID=A0AAJ6CV49_9CHLR|nr:DUF58 domain-containing protein [SAR202 cluster bacterium JH702]MDG0870510.1 DUF58 domain-containing protein [SAR202 cluster bacterium JH639]WFG35945.1 DUF58 domain-containing protein [SAR202 cluster bacterium JH545]WFG39889.1 DUF58 domain-containing protein [SAR202 cluster bacterium JH1073]